MKRQVCCGVLLSIFIFSCTVLKVHSETVDCSFPDGQWVSNITGSHIKYSESTPCFWGCDNDKTGNVCKQSCPTYGVVTCDTPGQRRTPCSPPLMPECVACHQDGNEATEGAYLFEASQNNGDKYNLLRGFGSFEYSKIYPDSNQFIRNAVNSIEANKGVPDTRWFDVMFNNDNPPFFGVGKIDLHDSHTMNLGAMGSKVFAQLSAPFARLSICELQMTSTAGEDDPKRIHGLVYEFQYRQRLAFPDPITMNTKLVNKGEGVVQSIYGSGDVELHSTSKWKRFQGLIDYTETMYGYPISSTCFQLEFDLSGYNEMLLDDVRIFANVFGNSKFNKIESNERNFWQVIGEEDFVTIEDSHGILAGGSGISQPALFHIDDFPDTKLAAIFSMQVKGNGTLHVLYHRPGSGIEDVLIYTILTGSGSTSDEWKTFRIPLTIHVSEPTTEMHRFKIRNVGDIDTTLMIDNTYLYVDDWRCPVMQCKDPLKRVFLNGQCQLCADSDEATQPCPSGRKQTGCIVDQVGLHPNCTHCEPVGTDGTDEEALGNWEDTIEECTWKCSSGFWFSRSENTCNTCTPLHMLRCNVGSYGVTCSSHADAKCQPCNILNRYDDSLVYTSGGAYDTDNYNQTEEIQCTFSCTPGQFQYAVNPENHIPLCYPCTTSICGAADDGNSALRMLDGFQYTEKCTATADSRCKKCESTDTEIAFTSNGNAIGDWCNYQCSAGHKPCGTCQWDPTSAVVINNTRIPWSQTLMVRFTGSATFHSAAFGSQFSIRVFVSAESDQYGTNTWEPPDQTGVAVNLFPIVSPKSLANQISGFATIMDPPEQKFDITIEARDFINTPNYNVWNSLHVKEGVHVFLIYEISDLAAYEINVTNFIVQIVNSTDGCCAERRPDTEVDPSTLSRCLPCEYAKGLASSLPENAHWLEADDCSWDCDTLFEILPDGNGSICESCPNPDCENGKYWTECGTCEDCENLLQDAFFTGPGINRRDRTSCPIQCSENFFMQHNWNSSQCVQCTTLEHLDCTNISKTMGNFFGKTCSPQEDASCIDCLICGIGWNTTKTCGDTNDALCDRCDANIINMPSTSIDGGAEWIMSNIDGEDCKWDCVEGRQYNPENNTCFVCDHEKCTVGQYPVECKKENQYDSCKQCESPKNSNMVSVGELGFNNSCAFECKDGYEYNGTLHSCVEAPVRQQPHINTPTEEHCAGTLCAWGQFFDETFKLDPCSAMCSECEQIPDLDKITSQGGNTVWIRKSSCQWTCLFPFLLLNGTCVLID